MRDLLDGRGHVYPQVVIIVYDLHRAPAQHVRRAYEHRIADAVGDLHRLFDLYCGLALWLRDIELMQHFLKLMTVLGPVDIFQARAHDLHAALDQLVRQVDGGLSAELHDHAKGLLQIDDMHDILDRQRLEIQLI